MKKFSILLLTALLICALPLAALAAPSPNFDSAGGDGSGPGANAHLITSATHLNNVRLPGYASDYFILGNDITLTATWTPIGPFGGNFDGDGHVINGLVVNTGINAGSNAGLFGVTLAGAVIENLGLLNVTVTGINNVGGLVGNNQGEIINSFVTGTVSGVDHVGGLVGRNVDVIDNSFATADVTGTGIDAGGLVGLNLNVVENTYATSVVTGNNNVGGLVGRNTTAIDGVLRSVAMGNVTGNNNVGAVVGNNAGGALALSNNFRYEGVEVNNSVITDTNLGHGAGNVHGGSFTAAELMDPLTWGAAAPLNFTFGGNPWSWQTHAPGYGFPALPGATEWPFPFSYTPAPVPTLTLMPSSVTLTNDVIQPVLAGGTATGAITVGTLTPPNADIEVEPTAMGVTVEFTGTMPHAGALAAITSGPHTVIVTREGVPATLTIDVDIPAFGVTVPVDSITVTSAGGVTVIGVGQTLQMHANVTPANATNSAVTWSVLPPVNGVATINPATGLLTAVGLGTVTVRATAVDGSGEYGELPIAVTTVGDNRRRGGGCNVASGLLAMLLMLPLFFVVKRK